MKVGQYPRSHLRQWMSCISRHVHTKNCSCGTLLKFFPTYRLYDNRNDDDHNTIDTDNNTVDKDYIKVNKDYYMMNEYYNKTDEYRSISTGSIPLP